MRTTYDVQVGTAKLLPCSLSSPEKEEKKKKKKKKKERIRISAWMSSFSLLLCELSSIRNTEIEYVEVFLQTNGGRLAISIAIVKMIAAEIKCI